MTAHRHRLRSIARAALLSSLILTVLASGAHAKDIRFAGMRLGTAWYVFSATLYKLMADEMPEGTRFEIFAKGGGIANPLLVDMGKVDVALANRATAVWARDGHPLVYGGERHDGLRVLIGGLNSVPVSAMVRAEYARRTGHDSLEKIFASGDPVRVVMKPKGSSVPVVADMIFAALGTSRAKIRANGGTILQVSAKQIPDVLRNRQADVYFESMPRGHPTVTQISLTVDVRFLDLPDRVIEKLAEVGLAETVIPKSWKGQERATRAVDLGTVIITHERLPEEIAYRFTKTICEKHEALAKAHKAWASFNPEDAWKPEGAGIKLHPGAERYYRERGWLKD